MKMLAKMEDLAPAHASSPFSFEFREPFATPNPLLVMEDGFAGYTLDDSGKKAIVCNIKLSLTQDLRIDLLGINGADDPTNHLDLQIREVSTVALAQFEGTLVLVSHDHHLLRATTDEFMIAVEGALSPFDGDLELPRHSPAPHARSKSAPMRRNASAAATSPNRLRHESSAWRSRSPSSPRAKPKSTSNWPARPSMRKRRKKRSRR